MEGNGQFVIKPANNKMPMRLQLNPMGNGAISVVASLGDGTIQTLCVFREGKLITCNLSAEISKKLGVEMDGFGHIRVCTR